MTQPTSTGQDWALGLTAFAAIFMMISGVVTAIQGIVALANSEFYVVGEEYTFEFDITAWGWILLCCSGVSFNRDFSSSMLI